MNDVLPLPGFHYGVPYEEYARWDAINFSRLKPIRDTASKCKWAMDHPKKPTAAMILGSALHIAVLEPARFDSMFFICPPCNRTTTKGKEIWEQAVKDAAGREILRQGHDKDKAAIAQLEKIPGMAKAIHNSKAAAPYLKAAGRSEVSMLWKDEETGLMCKGRMDKFIEAFDLLGGAPVILELKSSGDARAWSFGKDVDTFGYSAQAASYRGAVKQITRRNPIHVFIVAENEPPHDLKVYELDDEDIQTGDRLYRQMLRRYAACVKSGQWPGYPDKQEVLKMPTYANERNYQDL